MVKLSLFNFLNGETTKLFKNTVGYSPDGKKFKTTGNKEFFLPIRNKNRRVISKVLIKKDSLIGKIFHKSPGWDGKQVSYKSTWKG